MSTRLRLCQQNVLRGVTNLFGVGLGRSQCQISFHFSAGDDMLPLASNSLSLLLRCAHVDMKMLELILSPFAVENVRHTVNRA